MPRIPQEMALVGIDVSKERLDVHARPSGATRCARCNWPEDAGALALLTPPLSY